MAPPASFSSRTHCEALVYVRPCRLHGNLGDATELLWDDEPETSRR